jgi:hypothetical protein
MDLREAGCVVCGLDLTGSEQAPVAGCCECSPYLKENTTLHHYKDQLVNAV